MRKLLLGDEAIAQAAIDSGLSGVYAYPGTPSTEITEFIQLREEKRGDAENKIFCRWATNEKTAMEGALGMSYMILPLLCPPLFQKDHPKIGGPSQSGKD